MMDHVPRTAALAALFLCAAPAQSPIARDILLSHNVPRARVHVPDLKWSDQLAGIAQAWADSLIASGKFDHRPNSTYGENLYEMRGAHATPAQVVASWISEAKDYDYAHNACRAGAVCGHYTQVVWRTTQEVGCAVARNAKREVWVCNYNPPGNWAGQKPY